MDNNKQTLEKTYTINDIIFAGFGYIVGAGIFTLLPFIIKYSKGNTWLAFVLGGIISILTGLSYAKLNLELPNTEIIKEPYLLFALNSIRHKISKVVLMVRNPTEVVKSGNKFIKENGSNVSNGSNSSEAGLDGSDPHEDGGPRNRCPRHLRQRRRLAQRHLKRQITAINGK